MEPPEPPAPETASPVGPAAERMLCRDDVNGVITGVAAGLGRHTGTDPVVWRTAFAVTALAGGTGVWLYIAAWLLTRDARGGPAMLEQLLDRRLSGEAVLALLGAGLALGALFSLVGGFGWTTLVLAVPLILGGLVAHNRGVDLSRVARRLPEWLKSREPPPSAPAPEPSPAYYNPAQPWAAAPSGPIDLAVVGRQAAEGGGDCGAQSPPWKTSRRDRDGGTATKRDRRRGVSLLGVVCWVVLALTAVVFALSDEVSVGALVGPQAAPLYLGGIVALLGAALVVGTWVGDPRGVTWAATLVTLLATAATAVDLTQVRFGETAWRPAAASEVREPFELTVGQARLDLTALPLEPGQEVTVRARVGFGSLEVLAPETARVVVHGRAAFGSIELGDSLSQTGTRLDLNDVLEPVSVSGEDGEEGTAVDAPTLTLDLRSHAGNLEVWHVPT
ncbi:PspC domain-containing protein [Thermobifida halotolerans]|uniref:PspC domain-containing protein n=1 Tax=Thermobifida halotolerans TaxID=483545 RepID=UPI000A89A896|nr:PspC domain-containing protein [Thermobifida halotolerans]